MNEVAAATSYWVAPSLTSGLGNRLFQFAAAAGLAERWGRRVVFLLPRCLECPHGEFNTIFKLFPEVPCLESAPSWEELQEPHRGLYQCHPLGATGPQENLVMRGYWQCPGYFPSAGIRPNWFNALGPEHQDAIETAAGLKRIRDCQRTVAVHVRLGDYRLLQHHQEDLSKYYLRAFTRIPLDCRIHIFSDEPAAAAELLSGLLKGREFTVAEKRADVETLYEMSLCLGGFVTGNSTFSWWGAYFAHQRGCLWATYPSHLGPGLPDPVDYVPDWGTTIETRE